MDSVWDSESAHCGFESECCHLADYVTSLGKMLTPFLPLSGEGMGTTRLILALDTPLKFNGSLTPEGLWD